MRRVLFFFCALSFYIYSQTPSLCDPITLEDREVLDSFFTALLVDGDFAYTFAGAKPISYATYMMGYAIQETLGEKYAREVLLVHRGIDVWKKYEHLFPMKKFVMCIIQNPGKEYFNILLINKEKKVKIIRKNISLFWEHYQHQLSETEILDEVCKGNLFTNTQINHKILGLLLGYPKDDVETFCRRVALENVVSSLPLELKDSSRLRQLTELRVKFRRFPLALSDHSLFPIRTPFFMTTKEDNELRDMRASYKTHCSDLIEHYYSSDFLEKTLMRFI